MDQSTNQSNQSPGVYINEVNAFPNSIVPVSTAVPAFIGYTPKASYEGKSYTNVPVRITSFADFQAYFCLPEASSPVDYGKQYSPGYYLVPQKTQPANTPYIVTNGLYYAVVPDPNTIYYLYNSVEIFYNNGGGTAYIVSVGPYGHPSGKPVNAGELIVNPNVQLNDLTAGLQLLANQQEPTLYICPEATLLSIENNGTLMQSMLLQASTTQTAVCLFDIIGGKAPDPAHYTDDITTFRTNTGSIGLGYGAAYYPFIGTTLMQSTDIDYTNLFGGDITSLAAIINPADNPNPEAAAVIATIQDPKSTPTVQQNNNALLIASPVYSQIIKEVLNDANILPPSGAMAGVITTVDNNVGPWQAPANTSIVGVATLPIYLTDIQQANLNVDAVSGKSVNAIRSFNNLGILIWGARTMDGNSEDWKYLPVRRTMIFIEQSCRQAAQAYVFSPNNAFTWQAVVAMISSFLNGLWKQGGLQGASAAEAYSVACGLGTTMTGDDILNGFMNVTIKVAVIHPAEFIVINIQQQMATSS